MAIAEVTIEELAVEVERGARLIDVREVDEYADGHVPGAILVVLSTVPDNVDAFVSDEAVFVICRSGGRSMQACRFLAEQGIEVSNVAGGTLAWISSGRDTALGDQPA